VHGQTAELPNQRDRQTNEKNTDVIDSRGITGHVKLTIHDPHQPAREKRMHLVLTVIFKL